VFLFAERDTDYRGISIKSHRARLGNPSHLLRLEPDSRLPTDRGDLLDEQVKHLTDGGADHPSASTVRSGSCPPLAFVVMVGGESDSRTV